MVALQAGLDRAQQCELLRSLLDCWAELPGELDLRAMQCLEHFMQGHPGFRHAPASPCCVAEGLSCLLGCLPVGCWQLAGTQVVYMLWWYMKGERRPRATARHTLAHAAHWLSRWGQIIDLLEAAYGTDAAIALCEHLLFAGGGSGNGMADESNGTTAGPEQREAKLREATLKCARLRTPHRVFFHASNCMLGRSSVCGLSEVSSSKMSFSLVRCIPYSQK